MKKIFLLLSFIFLMVFYGCSADPINIPKEISVCIGDTFTLTKGIKNASVKIGDQAILTTLDDENTFFAMDYGKTEVTTKIKKKTYTTSVTITIGLDFNKTLSLTAKRMLKFKGSYDLVSYKVSTNSEFLKIEDGKLFGTKPGNYTLTVTYTPKNITQKFPITVIEAFPEILVSQDYTLVNKKVAIVIINSFKTDDFSLSYDEGLEQVNKENAEAFIFTSKKKGEYNVNLTLKSCPEITFKKTVVFKENENDLVYLDHKNGFLSLKEGDEEKLLLNEDNKLNFSFKSTDTTIALVGENGNVIAANSLSKTNYAFILVKQLTDEKIFNKFLVKVENKTGTIRNYNELIYQKAVGELGYTPPLVDGEYGDSKYGKWHGFGAGHWCAMFVSWCANEAGISGKFFRVFSNCDEGALYFGKNNPNTSFNYWKNRADYIPVRGDIIFFDWENDGNLNHVGIVDRVENDVVYTVEGNSGNSVRRQNYSQNDKRIIGYVKLTTK